MIELIAAVVVLGMMYLFALKGLELLSPARVFVLGQQIDRYRAAVQQYEVEYRALPGDDPGALGRWRETEALFNTSKGPVSLAGNGKIDGLLDDSANPLGEQYMAWRDLRSAGLVAGDVEIVGQSARPETIAGITYGFAEYNLGLQQVLCLTRVPGGDAAKLDKRFDDGVINTGRLRGTSRWDPVGANNHFEKPDDSAYDAEKTYIICLPALP